MAARGPAPAAPAAAEAAEKGASQARQAGTLTLPKDIFDTLVDALAEALVADYQQDTTRMVRSPPGKDHDIERRRS